MGKSHETLNNSDLNQGKSSTPFFDYLSAKILEEIRLTKNKCDDLNFLENKLTSMEKYESQLSRELLGRKVTFF